MRPVHTIALDLDDTLFAEADYVREGFAAADRYMVEVLGVSGLKDSAVAAFTAGFRGNIFNRALQEIGIEDRPPLVQKLVEAYRQNCPALQLLPDAASFLEWAANQGVRLALLTDGYAAVQRKKIDALGIERLFAVIVVSDEMGREFWKPHPEGYLRIMKALPGDPSGYIYIGDNPQKDFVAPQVLGWQTARIRRPDGEYSKIEFSDTKKADFEIKRLSELITGKITVNATDGRNVRSEAGLT